MDETLERLCSSSCSCSLGRAVAWVVRRRRRRACARAGRRRRPGAHLLAPPRREARDARRPGRDAGSRRLRARLQGSSTTSILTPRSSLATSSGGEAWATGPIRRRAARKHPARPRPQRRGWREPPSPSRREWRSSPRSPTSKTATRARGTIGPSGALDAQPRGARAPRKLDIKLRHGRALLPSASNLTLLDQFRRSDYPPAAAKR